MGRSIAQHLARRGDAVAVVDVNGEAAEQVAEELREDGGRAVASQADVSDRADVDSRCRWRGANSDPWGFW